MVHDLVLPLGVEPSHMKKCFTDTLAHRSDIVSTVPDGLGALTDLAVTVTLAGVPTSNEPIWLIWCRHSESN